MNVDMRDEAAVNLLVSPKVSFVLLPIAPSRSLLDHCRSPDPLTITKLPVTPYHYLKSDANDYLGYSRVDLRPSSLQIIPLFSHYVQWPSLSHDLH